MRTQPPALALVLALRSAAASALLMLVHTVSMAGYVTTNEAGVDAIYAQLGFPGTGVDIFFDVPIVLVRPDLLVVDSVEKLNALRDAVTSQPRPTVNMYFVDTITFCGFVNTFTGCATPGGNFIALDSNYAGTSPNGANAVAHELGHNLGLGHLDGTATNLMNPVISANSLLTANQITTIMGSTLLQSNIAGQKFVTVSPIAVVPEPAPGVLLLLGAAAIGIARRQHLFPCSALRTRSAA